MNRGTMGVNSLPKTVTRQCRGCDLNPGPSVPESSTLTTRLSSHPSLWLRCRYCYDAATWLVDARAGSEVRTTDWWTLPPRLVPATVRILSRHTRTIYSTRTDWRTQRYTRSGNATFTNIIRNSSHEVVPITLPTFSPTYSQQLFIYSV